MPVAKTYCKYEILTEPYIMNKRKYVKINYKGVEKEVRWYTDNEYKRMYQKTKTDNSEQLPSQRKILGFGDKGTITIYTGVTENTEPLFRRAESCRYSKFWGWYTPSGEPLIDPIPEGVGTRLLEWSAVKSKENPERLASDSKVKAAVEAVVSGPEAGVYFGNIGERYEFTLTCIYVHEVNTTYGLARFHIFEDDYGNRYTWFTSSRTLIPGTTYTFKGTVKDHNLYQGKRQTVLTRCSGF